MSMSLGLDEPSTSGQITNEDFELSDYVVPMNEAKCESNDEDNREKRIQFLTLAPHSWSLEKNDVFWRVGAGGA